MTDIPVTFFAVRRAICAILSEDHLVHVEGIPPSSCQTTKQERAGEHNDSQDQSCRGITFFTPDGTSCLLGLGNIIAEVSQLLSPLLASQALPYDEVLNWIQFTYTGNRFGAYVDPASMEFTFHNLSEGELIFTMSLQRLRNLYPGAYTQGPTSTIGPLGSDYKLYANHKSDPGMHLDILSFGWDPHPIRAHNLRNIDVGLEAGAHDDLYPNIDYALTDRVQRNRENTGLETLVDRDQHILSP